LPEDELSGYTGVSRDILSRAGARIGDRVRIEAQAPSLEAVEGILMPRFQTEEEEYVVVKLGTGYNVGVRVNPSTNVSIVGKGAQPHFTRAVLPEKKPGLPEVTIMSTGGTIASKVDYRTGAVKPALDAEDLYSVVPELASVADINAKILLSIFSENLGPSHWTRIAQSIADEVKQGVDGVVIAHGTDTMGYTAAAMSFALKELPVPVVFVGAQRSADRPSSDAATNLLGAVAVAGSAPFAEVCVAMHETISDEKIAVHRGTKVRKCHTSRRDAFRSVNTPPIAYYDTRKQIVQTNSHDLKPRSKGKNWKIYEKFDPNVALIKFHPGISPGVIDWATATGFKGIVLEGSGLGHVGDMMFQSLERAIKDGVVVAMCSQCIWGRVHMNVYSTGRDLLRMGVVPMGDMLAETALVKMMWAFGQDNSPEKVKEVMVTNVAREFSERRFLEEIPE